MKPLERKLMITTVAKAILKFIQQARQKKRRASYEKTLKQWSEETARNYPACECGHLWAQHYSDGLCVHCDCNEYKPFE